MFGAVDKRPLWALYVAQVHAGARYLDLIGANCNRRVVNGAYVHPRIVQSQKRDHIVLIDAIAGYTDAAGEGIAFIDGYAAGEDLNTIGEIRNSGAILFDIVPHPEQKEYMTDDLIEG